MNTIDPVRLLFMCPATARTVKNCPSRLTDITRRHSSVDIVSTELGRPGTPALAKQESICPKRSRVAATPAATAASSPTSTVKAATGAVPSALNSVTAASLRCALVPQIATDAPA